MTLIFKTALFTKFVLKKCFYSKPEPGAGAKSRKPEP